MAEGKIRIKDIAKIAGVSATTVSNVIPVIFPFSSFSHPESKGGNSPDGRKVKGTIHWVAAKTAVKAECRLYENLIDEEKGVYNEDGSMNLNPNSLTVLKECYLEPSLKDAKAYDSFQFVRNGFFCVDAKDSKEDALVFNRIVSLKSSFKLPAAK